MQDVTVTCDQASSDHRVLALLQIEEFVEAGQRVSHAIAQVSSQSGIAVRTLYLYRKMTDFVPRSDWAATIAPKWNPAQGMQVECHPAALCRFVELCRTGIGISKSYRQILVEARAHQWEPIPPERTMRRELDRRVDRAEMRRSRRHASSL